MIQRKSYGFWIILLALFFFFPFLGGVHLFDWDEINFAEIAREMIISNNYLQPSINFEPFWEKPPLFIWMQALSFHIFGVNEYAARFPNAVAGLTTLLFLYYAGQRIRNKEFALWWVLAYLGSILPHLYFKSGIIDPWFNLFTFVGIYYFYLFHQGEKQFKFSTLSGLFLGLAVLTKGPVALGLFGIIFLVYYIFNAFRGFISPKFLLFWLLTFISVNGLWYGVETWKNGTWFMEQFILYQIRLFMIPDAGHGGFFGYHFAVLLLGCFPASAFAVPALFRKTQTYETDQFKSFIFLQKIILWVVLIVFSIVTTKIVHYSSLAYFPISYLAASELYRIIQHKEKMALFSKIFLPFNGILFILALWAIPILYPFRDQFISLIGDQQAKAALVETELHFAWWTFIPGFIMLAVLILSKIFFKVAPTQSMRYLFIGNAIVINLTLYAFIGKIEAFSQRPAIDTFTQYAGKPVNVYGYKSYAHLFYGKVSRHMPKAEEGMPGEDMIVVAKISKREEIENRFPHWVLMHEKAGWLTYLNPASKEKADLP